MTRQKIHQICKNFNIKDYVINDDYSIDVYGDVKINNYGLEDFPLKFRNIYGDFDFSYNNIESFENGPKYVKGSLILFRNKICSLLNVPFVGKDFACSKNKLYSMKGCQDVIYGNLHCTYNYFSSLNDFPKIVLGKLYHSFDFSEEKIRTKIDVKDLVIQII